MKNLKKTKITPLIISGMYRSGTSLIWRLLSEDPLYYNCYYEPLHPKLPLEIKKSDVFREYKKNLKIINKWSPNFNIDKFYLNKNQSFSDLKNYLDDIIRPGNLIKFTRTTLRLGWILNNFKSTKVINIIRNPKAVCFSYMERGRLPFQKNNFIKDLIKEAENIKSIKESHIIIFNLFKNKYLEFNAEHRQPSIYNYNEYLRYLKYINEWKEYASYLSKNEPMVRILGLWRINIEKSISDIKQYPKRAITIRHEDLCRSPKKIINSLYSFLDRDTPDELIESLGKNKDIDHFKIKTHKFHKPINTEWLEQWKKVDNKLWEKSIKKARIAPLMQKMGYNV